MTLDAIEVLPQTQLDALLQNILISFSLNQWAKIVLYLAWFTFFFFVLYRFSQRMQFKRIFFILGCFFLLVTQKEAKQTKAVVFNQEIEIWAEPNKRADILFLLHEGTTLVVLSELEGWSKIKLANGSEGWVENTAIKTLN